MNEREDRDRSLKATIRAIDGGPFGLYRRLVGRHRLGEFALTVDSVPPDPFAGPARMRVAIERERSGLDVPDLDRPARRLGVEDFVARRASQALDDQGETGRRVGPGQGRIRIQELGQAVVERSACRLTADRLELRCHVHLPAARRRIRGLQAEALLLGTLRRVATASLLFSERGRRSAAQAADGVEDHAALQSSLRDRGLVAFVANGSRLARAAGDDDRPRAQREQVPFESPPEREVTLTAPHAGDVTGLGIPAGVTVVVGGGFHGKSTLLEALVRGVHPHVKGDGRERVVTVADAVPVRAEDGRVVREVDISGFLGTLPGGERANRFSTDRASGSTSQAASVAEAMESGASLLLLDEDRSATNFMIRDGRMQRLVPIEAEPIVPFVDRVRELYDRFGVSTILVTGGSGDYLEVADTVIGLDRYHARDWTDRSREVVAATRSVRLAEARAPLEAPAVRRPSFDRPDRSAGRVSVRGERRLRVGDDTVDLTTIEPLSEPGQVRALAALWDRALDELEAGATFVDWIARVDAWLGREGLDRLQPPAAYELSRPRREEIAAAFNRWRGWRTERGRVR